MVKLFKLLGAVAKDGRYINECTRALVKYASDIKIGKITTPDLKIISGTAHIGNVPAIDVAKMLKFGRVNEAVKIIYKLPNPPSTVVEQIAREVSSLPSFKLGKNLDNTLKLKDALKTTPNFSKFDTATDLTEDAVKSSTKMTALLNWMNGKRFLGITGGTVFVTGGIIYLIKSINEYRIKNSGCFRYELKDGTMSTCRVVQCSCVDGAPTTQNLSNCADSVIPENMRSLEACKSTTGITCVNCPPVDVEEDASFSNESSLESSSKSDSVCYKCNVMSPLDAIGDIIGDNVDNALNQVNMVKDELFSGFSTILSVLKYVAMALGVIFVIGLAYWGYQKINIDIKYSQLKEEI